MSLIQSSSVHLHDLILNTKLGWTETERNIPQPIILEIKIQTHELPKACLSDNLGDTLCYAKIVHLLKTKLTEKEFKLLEHLTYEIYQTLKQNISKDTFISIRTTKHLPIPDVKGKASFYLADAGGSW